MAALPRGLCPVCDKSVALRVTGELREHRRTGKKGWCEGSGGWPAFQVVIEVDQ